MTENSCSLTLKINGRAFGVRRTVRDGLSGWNLRPKDGADRLRVEKDRWGVVRCDCLASRGQNPEKFLCEHARALQALGLIGPSFRAKNKPKHFVDTVI